MQLSSVKMQLIAVTLELALYGNPGILAVSKADISFDLADFLFQMATPLISIFSVIISST